MEIGIIGLGKMGSGLTRRMLNGGHSVVAFDIISDSVELLVSFGARPAHSIKNLLDQLSSPKVVWVMTPAGDATEMTIHNLAQKMSPGDGIIDGGNSHFQDSIRRAKFLKSMQLFLLDVGTSGGVRGFENGYSLMIGGESVHFRRLEPIFKTLAPSPNAGYGLVGPSGAGHFIKMVHNGIEYGIMQSYAEGFEIVNAKKEFDFSLPQVAEIWRSGSVVRSWLLELISEILDSNPNLDHITGTVQDSGETRWLVQEAINLDVPAPIISLSLLQRLQSRTNDQYSHRLLSSLRHLFGGHSVSNSDEN